VGIRRLSSVQLPLIIYLVSACNYCDGTESLHYNKPSFIRYKTLHVKLTHFNVSKINQNTRDFNCMHYGIILNLFKYIILHFNKSYEIVQLFYFINKQNSLLGILRFAFFPKYVLPFCDNPQYFAIKVSRRPKKTWIKF